MSMTRKLLLQERKQMIKLDVKIVARNKLFDMSIRYRPSGQFLIEGVDIEGIDSDVLSEHIYNHGRGLLLAACDGDMVLFHTSDAFFILDYELPVKLTEEHLKTLVIANKTCLPKSQDKKTWLN